MNLKKAKDIIMICLEARRQYKTGKMPVYEIEENLQAALGRLSSEKQKTIEQKIDTAHIALNGRTDTEKSQIIEGFLEDTPEIQAFIEYFQDDVAFQRRIQQEIASQLDCQSPIVKEVMQALLDDLAHRLGCSADNIAVAQALTNVSSAGLKTIRENLRTFTFAVEKVLTDLKNTGNLPKTEWGEQVWTAFSTLLLLAVDLTQVQRKQHGKSDTQTLPGIETLEKYTFTLALTNGRLNQTFPRIVAEQDHRQSNDEILIHTESDAVLLNTLPQDSLIQGATEKAIESLLGQIYDALDTTPYKDPNERVKYSPDTLDTIKEMLEDEAAADIPRSYYLKVKKDHFTDPVWIKALQKIDQQLNSALIIFSVTSNAGKGAKTGLLLFSDGACQQYINDMRTYITSLNRS